MGPGSNSGGTIGEGSNFEEIFGVHGHGVTLDAFVAPADWFSRARVFVEPRTGLRVRAPSPLAVAASAAIPLVNARLRK